MNFLEFGGLAAALTDEAFAIAVAAELGFCRRELRIK
jgi:hypothetical protein